MEVIKVSETETVVFIPMPELLSQGINPIDLEFGSDKLRMYVTKVVLENVLNKADGVAGYTILTTLHSGGLQIMISFEDELVVPSEIVEGLRDSVRGKPRQTRSESSHTHRATGEKPYEVFKITNLDNVISACRRLQPLYAEKCASVLFHYKGDYLLVVGERRRRRDGSLLFNMRAVLEEYGENVAIPMTYLNEYGKLIVKNNAIKVMAELS